MTTAGMQKVTGQVIGFQLSLLLILLPSPFQRYPLLHTPKTVRPLCPWAKTVSSSASQTLRYMHHLGSNKQDVSGSGRGLGCCISDKLLGDTVVAGWGTTLRASRMYRTYYTQQQGSRATADSQPELWLPPQKPTPAAASAQLTPGPIPASPEAAHTTPEHRGARNLDSLKQDGRSETSICLWFSSSLTWCQAPAKDIKCALQSICTACGICTYILPTRKGITCPGQHGQCPGSPTWKPALCVMTSELIFNELVE